MGWLLKTTRYAALAQIRAVIKRHQHEQEIQMQSQPSAPDPLWEQIAPLLDDALADLGETDRRAVLLRYFESKSLVEVGRDIGAGEDAARKRVSRALEKLRRFFQKRGVVCGAGLLTGLLAANSVQAAPAGLASTITATVIKGSTAAASIMTLVKGTIDIMTWIKTKIILTLGVSAVLAGATVLTVEQQMSQNISQQVGNGKQEQALRAEIASGDLPPGQLLAAREKLLQLQTQQELLRGAQQKLVTQDAVTAHAFRFMDRTKQVSPFTKVEFNGDSPLVTCNGVKYGLSALNGVPAADIVAFCHTKYAADWQRRFVEDIVVVFSDMGHPFPETSMCSLNLTDLKTGQSLAINAAPLTEENRRQVFRAFHQTTQP